MDHLNCKIVIRFVSSFLLALTGLAMSAEIPPHFPRVSDEYQMTRDWRITLTAEFAKRFEKGKGGTDLVLWKKGMTCWISIYSKDGMTPESTLEWLKEKHADGALETFEHAKQLPYRLGSLYFEKPDDDHSRWALYTYTIGKSGHVLMAIYFDDKEQLEEAKRIWFAVEEVKAGEPSFEKS